MFFTIKNHIHCTTAENDRQTNKLKYLCEQKKNCTENEVYITKKRNIKIERMEKKTSKYV